MAQLELFGDMTMAGEKQADKLKLAAPRATILPFPSARFQYDVRKLAERLAPLSADEREAVWKKHSSSMLGYRQREGLSLAQARADVVEFRDAVRKLVAYIEPSGRPARCGA